jgi:hypothetical protein
MKLTKEQQRALLEVYRRKPLGFSFLAFRRSGAFMFNTCFMIPWQGMVLGIELDGHTHS